jgi:hypothetical protein
MSVAGLSTRRRVRQAVGAVRENEELWKKLCAQAANRKDSQKLHCDAEAVSTTNNAKRVSSSWRVDREYLTEKRSDLLGALDVVVRDFWR